jgi:hypothetical protein
MTQGMVAYSYNPGYSGGRDWKEHSFRPAQSKLVKPHPNQ